MKKIQFICMIAVLLILSGCEKNEEVTSHKLKGTCWASESSIMAFDRVNRLYFYDVWYFTSETEGTYTKYYTTYNRVDIGNGDDPMKYGVVEANGKIYVNSYNFPNISIREVYSQYGKNNDKTYDGCFVSEDFLLIDNSSRYLRVNRKTY